ncbi:hypothetical protein MTO96_046068 [Rhipicephalus appendiculatus]
MASRGPAFARENSSARLLTSREQRTEERMDFSVNQTRSTPTTTGNEADADSVCRTQTTTNVSDDDEEGWRTVLTLRQGSHLAFAESRRAAQSSYICGRRRKRLTQCTSYSLPCAVATVYNQTNVETGLH